MTQEERNKAVEHLRSKTEIYTRCVGYYRPVSQFNDGKRAEVEMRTMLKVE